MIMDQQCFCGGEVSLSRLTALLWVVFSSVKLVFCSVTCKFTNDFCSQALKMY